MDTTMENKRDVPATNKAAIPHAPDCTCLDCAIKRDQQRVQKAKQEAVAGQNTARYGDAKYGKQKFGQGRFA